MPQAANYDVIVIGTSQGGRFLPMTFAKAGRKVAVIEYGVRTGPVSVDLQAVRKRKRGMVEGARNNFESGITAVQGLDLDLLRGEAHFIASNTLGVSLTDGE